MTAPSAPVSARHEAPSNDVESREIRAPSFPSVEVTSLVARCAVPGKIMLAGEYAVLEGAPALACTVDLSLTVTVTPRTIAGARIHSTLWREPRELLRGRTPQGPLEAAVAFALTRYGISGADVHVTSEIDVSHGIGSSSALRLGVLLAAQALCESELDLGAHEAARWSAARDAFDLQRRDQRRASGYDVATQLVGGLVRFRAPENEARQSAVAASDKPKSAGGAWPAEAHRLPSNTFAGLSTLVHPFVGGAGAPTAPLVKGTLQWLAESGRGSVLRTASDALVAAFEAALAAPSDSALVRTLLAAVRAHRTILQDAPAFPTKVAEALAAIPLEGETWSFKTTGAGGEDALLLIGPQAATLPASVVLAALGWQPLPGGFTDVGARLHVGPAEVCQ